MEALEIRFKCPPILDAHESSSEYWKRWKKEFLAYMVNSGFVEESCDEQRNSPGNLTEKRKIAILLNLLGNRTHEIYRHFEFVKEKDRTDFKAVLKKFDEFYSNYYIPRLKSVVEGLNFSKYNQRGDISEHRNAPMEILSAFTFRPPQALRAEEINGENWKRWKEEFLIFMEASGFLEEKVDDLGNVVTAKVSDKRKIAILVNLLGEEARNIYSHLAFTHQSDKENFYTVLERFEEYYTPQINLAKERFKFFSVKQRVGESFASFYKNLRITSASSDFGDQRDRLMRDRIISEIRDKSIHRRLLERNNIILEEAVDLCHEAELAETLQASAVRANQNASNPTEEEDQASIWSIVAQM